MRRNRKEFVEVVQLVLSHSLARSLRFIWAAYVYRTPSYAQKIQIGNKGTIYICFIDTAGAVTFSFLFFGCLSYLRTVL